MASNRHCTGGREAGITMLELTITAAIMALVMRFIVSLAISGADAQEYARRLNRVTEVNQDVMDGIRTELASSVSLFGRDALSTAHFGRVDLGGWPAPLAGSLLPRIAANEAIVPDLHNPTNPKTGNMLFFAQRAWVDHYVTPGSGREYLIDVYQWVLYYLTRESPEAGDAVGLNLVHWVSEPLADGRRIAAITDPVDRAELLEHLALGTPGSDGAEREPVALVWLRGRDPGAVGTFQEIDPDAGYTLSAYALPPRADPFAIRAFWTQPRQGLLTLRHHSVATIHASIGTPVCRLGIPDDGDDGFPHAFEVQIVGPSAARQVFVRSSLLSTNQRGLRAHSSVQIVVDCRDL